MFHFRQGCLLSNHVIQLRSAASSDAILRGVGGDAISLEAEASTSSTPRMKPTVIYTGGFMTPSLDLPKKFRGPVVVDIAGIFYEDTVPLHRDHDTERPVGHTTRVSDDGQQLSAEGLFSIASDDTAEIVEGRKKGFPWRPSVGLKLYEYRQIADGTTVHVNGRDFTGPFLLVTQSELKEIGIVTVPGDAEVAPIQLAAKAGTLTMKFNAWLKAQGINAKTLKPLALNVLKAHYDSLQASDAGSDKKDDASAEAEDDEEDKADAEDDDESKMDAEDEESDEMEDEVVDESTDDEEEMDAEDEEDKPKAQAKAKASGSKQVNHLGPVT